MTYNRGVILTVTPLYLSVDIPYVPASLNRYTMLGTVSPTALKATIHHRMYLHPPTMTAVYRRPQLGFPLRCTSEDRTEGFL